MAKQTLNLGTTANDGTGTQGRAGGDLINDNFNELYTALGDGTTLNVQTAVQAVTLAEAQVTAHEAAIDHDALLNFVANEHIDWTADQGATNLHAGNVPDLSGTYEPVDADILRADTADQLTAGFSSTDHAAGTQSTGTYTPDPADGNFQTATNGGAHTLAPPAASCSIVVHYTNNASAGTITTSGFTLVDGDAFTTTDAHEFICIITKIADVSSLTVKALQ